MSDFYGARLKFLARVGCLGINENVRRWGKSDGTCELCNSEEETLLHFLFTCPISNFIRVKHYVKLEERLKESEQDFVWQKFVSGSLLTKLNMFLGSGSKYYGGEIEGFFDKSCKEYLVETWQFRQLVLDGPAF